MLNVCAITISFLSRGLSRPPSPQPLSWKCYPLAMVRPNQWICLISRSAACFAFWMFWENWFMLFADEYLFFLHRSTTTTPLLKKKSLKMYLHSYLCGPVSFSTGSLKHFATGKKLQRFILLTFVWFAGYFVLLSVELCREMMSCRRILFFFL